MSLPKPSKELIEVKTALTKKFGEDAVFVLGEKKGLAVSVIPTGSLLLDRALGVGGWPEGRIIEVYGHEGSGKSTVCQRTIAEAQKLGKLCSYVDVEHALDPEWAARQGIDLERLLVAQPDSGEQALDIVEGMIDAGVSVIVVDSVAALVHQAELDGEMSDQQVGLQARLMSKAMRKLKGKVAKNKCVLIFINQVREKVGVLFGNPEVTPGGRALKFYASVRVEMRRGDVYKEGKVVVGHQVKCKVTKNKVAAPYRAVALDLYYDGGIDNVKEVISLATAAGIIQKRGGWFKYTGDKEYSWQGMAGARAELLKDKKLYEEILLAVRQVFPTIQVTEEGVD